MRHGALGGIQRWYHPISARRRGGDESFWLSGKHKTMTTQVQQVNAEEYKFGFHDDDTPSFKAQRGLSPAVVSQISDMKDEPAWMREFRLKALEHFEQK